MQLVECVPNFSEGKNMDIIQSIARAIEDVPNVWLLHTDIGEDANRTVFTFVGDINTIGIAIINSIKVAQNLIDMRVHHGEHPRMGACDVCPLIPLNDTPVIEVINLSHRIAQRLGEEGIPVYMYEKSASSQERQNLSFHRKGEYEGLKAKLKSGTHLPDYGPIEFNEKFGAMVLGVRDFLIAYNVNLETKDISIAKKIASTIRESGYLNTVGIRIKGLLKGVKAIGWWMEAYQCAQVSTNIVDISIVNIKQVFDAVKSEANKYQVEVYRSELIGLVPEIIILDIAKELLPQETEKSKLYQSVFDYLGLSDIDENRILEVLLSKKLML
ncbi:MAG: glutamate formimidoyltransferase [Chitinophagales bacterium]|nr:glutamate formimidoyltransferase [Chitinophagales bacterium]MCZ2394786.1 glutamate formimidoyltransferase [Chitinophagales bacterium]